MSNKLIKYKYRNKSFAGYGLNKFRNFLQSPNCECGCGEKANVILKDKKELFGFMNGLLLDNNCDCCAIFAHSYDGNLYTAIKCVVEEENTDENDDDSSVKFFGVKDDCLTFFQELDAEIGLHCYGLMIETKRGEWEIIED